MISKPSPRVTIGISFYNNEKTLFDSIRSVFAQTYSDWEIILVNDGSTDNSTNIVERINDPRIRVVNHGERRGLSHRLNEIAQLARGKYLARMDADDLMHPDRIEIQWNYLEKNSEIDLVGTATFIIDDQLNVIGKRGESFGSTSADEVLRRRTLFVHPTVFGRAEWFRKNPYLEERWCSRAQDYELWIRTCQSLDNRFGHISTPLLYYRESGNFNYKRYRESMRCCRTIVKKYGPKLIGRLAANTLRIRFVIQEALYGLASLFRIEGKLLNKRNQKVNLDEYNKAIIGIKTIMACHVQGFKQ